MHGRYWLGAIALILTAGAVTAQEFENIGATIPFYPRIPADARGEAMGLATTVNPRGATAFWWNPAPLPDDRVGQAAVHVSEHPSADIDVGALGLRTTWGDLTAGVVISGLVVDDMVVRTAYDPVGEGDRVDFSQWLYTVGAAYDLAPRFGGTGADWSWTVGANLRVHEETIDDDTEAALDAGVGTSLALTLARADATWLRLHATSLVRNVFETDVPATVAAVGAEFPREWHGGVGLEGSAGGRAWGRDLMRATLAFTARRGLGGDHPRLDSEHLGLEVLLAEALSLRAGHRTDGMFDAAAWSWGAGLRHRFAGAVVSGLSLDLALDYASYDVDLVIGDHTLDQWTLSLGLAPALRE